MHRIVWDPSAGRTYVAQSHGSWSRLSGSAGQILASLRCGDDAQATATRNSYPQATSKMTAAGWLDPGAVLRTVDASPHLKRVQIEVSLRCNLSCDYCYSMSGPHHRGGLDRDRILALIDEADRMGVLTMDFTGGELLLDRAWSEYVTCARAAGIGVSIHTNGTLLTEPKITILQHLDVTAVQVSLDSHLEEMHDSIRGHRGALRRTLRGLDLLQEAGIPVRLSLMAHRDNIASLGETITYMAERYPKAVLNVDRIIATGGALRCDNGLAPAEFWEFIGPYMTGNVRAGKVCESAGNEDFEPDCGVAYSYVYVTAQGEIASCPTMTSRESPSFAGPSIQNTTLSDAWYKSELFTSFRFTNCENVTRCPAGTRCGGGCRSNAYVESGGSVTAPDVVACNTFKNGGPVFVDFPRRYASGEYASATVG